MREKYTALTPALHEYIVEHGSRQDGLLRRVEEETEALGDIAVMQVAADQGAFLTLLTRLTGARLAVEVGTFTGYSAVCIARGLEPGGRLICCELDEGYAETARANLHEAGLEEVADIRIGPAGDTLRKMPRTDEVDFAFIDADKAGYRRYYEELLERLRRGGLIALDNVLLGGRVLDPAPNDESAQSMARLNDSIAVDERVDCVMLGVADGITVARKR